MTAEYIAELSEIVRATLDATDRGVMGVIYLHLVGHDISQESPELSLNEIRALALEYILEACTDADIDPRDVGIGDDVSDESRSYGPRY
jgi:hypothetical protein